MGVLCFIIIVVISLYAKDITFTICLYTFTCNSMSLVHYRMGATLSSIAELTSANDKDEGKIQYSPQNETLLNNVLRYVDILSSNHKREAEVVFKQPFQWRANIKPSDFEKQSEYEIRCVCSFPF